MATLVADDSLWPLGVMIAEGRQELALHSEMLKAWNNWLARGERFVALRVYRDEVSLEHEEGVARATKAWLRDGAADAIRANVSAMVIVVPAASFGRMQGMSVQASFGVPGSILADIGEALEWLTAAGHLKGAGARCRLQRLLAKESDEA